MHNALSLWVCIYCDLRMENVCIKIRHQEKAIWVGQTFDVRHHLKRHTQEVGVTHRKWASHKGSGHHTKHLKLSANLLPRTGVSGGR